MIQKISLQQGRKKIDDSGRVRYNKNHIRDEGMEMKYSVIIFKMG